MQIRIRAVNSHGNVPGVPSPRVDLVFEKEGTRYALLYFMEPTEIVPECGPSPPWLQICIADLSAVVAALREAPERWLGEGKGN